MVMYCELFGNLRHRTSPFAFFWAWFFGNFYALIAKILVVYSLYDAYTNTMKFQRIKTISYVLDKHQFTDSILKYFRFDNYSIFYNCSTAPISAQIIIYKLDYIRKVTKFQRNSAEIH